MDNNEKLRNFLKRYLLIFAFIAFAVTCSFLLFFSYTDADYISVKYNALVTFGNIIFMSVIFAFIGGALKRAMIDEPMKKILKTTNKLAEGHFEARVETDGQPISSKEFKIIAENINKMAEELSGIETLRTDFVSNVSHELKTPLAVIGNYSTMLQNPDLTEAERIEYAKDISDATGRLSELITNILKLNKLENQQIYPEKKRYDLGEQLCECLVSFENVWEEKNIELSTDIEDNLVINADREMLSLVWNNLLSNAFKFTEAGGTVSVSVKSDGNNAIVKVSDTGCGISSEAGKHIFDRFYQGDTSHAKNGNGLGLALVKRVIDLCNADIKVNSVVNKGTVFTVVLKI